jgi:hypothetical protein
MRKAMLILCLTAAAAPARADLAQDLLACARIADDARRLACYDRFATEVIEIGLSGTAAGGAAAGRSAAAPATAPTAAQPAAAGTPDLAAPAAAATPSAADSFGLDESGSGPKKITSNYVGEFTGWDGDTIFRLENGQVWQQAEQGRMSWRAENPEVTISRGMFGVYRLSVKGVNKKVKVKRIQ